MAQIKMTDSLTTEQRRFVNKRLSLNLLIQGAAAHAHWSAHHLVEEALNALAPELFPLYTEMMTRIRLGYWVGGIPSIMGSPIRFWLQLGDEEHEFSYHPFFLNYGHKLATESRVEAFERCKKGGLSTHALMNELRGLELYQEALTIELPHQVGLVKLAKDICCQLYGIDRTLLLGKLTPTPLFGKVRPPETLAGEVLMECMIGWSAVVRSKGRLKVRAAATIWPLLVHEFVKGTMELICLHGLNTLEEEDYQVVLDRTDHVEFEIPMLQIGGAVFRRLLDARPREVPLAQCVVCVSKMDSLEIDRLFGLLIDSPNRATDMIRSAYEADR